MQPFNFISCLLLILAIALTPAQAMGNCTKCHAGIEPILDKPPMRDLPCEFCHMGDPEADNKDMAHDGLIENPSDYRVAEKTCGVCHYTIFLDSKKSLHATSAGIISGARFAWGAQAKKGAIYGNYRVMDMDGDIPRDAGALKALKRLPGFDPNRPIGPYNHPVDDYLRSECLRCHLWTPGARRKGDYRSSGCAACHVLYADDGLYRGKDKAISKTRPGRPIRHRVTVKISPEQCIHCHNRGGRTGVSYIGMMESDGYGAPWGNEPGVKAGEKLHGKYYNHLTPDIHYERGITCIDCHTERDLHGDGNIYSKKEEAVEIECTDCHGTRDKVSSLTTSRGNPMPWLKRKGGKIVLVSKIDHRTHIIPQVKDILQSGNSRAKAAMGLKAHTDHLECYACHATWAPQCYGCHVQADYSEHTPDWLAQGNPEDPSQAGARENLSKDAFKWRETRSYLRWEDPALGINSEGLVAPFIPGCQVIFTETNVPGRKPLKAHVFTTQSGISGISSNPIQPHTIRPKARSCENCHSNPKALGLGTGTFRPRENGIPVDFGLDQLVNEAGKQLQSTSHKGARPFNKAEISRILRVNVCAQCHQLSTDDKLWKAVLDKTDRALDNELHQKAMELILKEFVGEKRGQGSK